MEEKHFMRDAKLPRKKYLPRSFACSRPLASPDLHSRHAPAKSGASFTSPIHIRKNQPAPPTAAAKEGTVGFGQHPIGSGPFEITANVANQEITEVRNPAYDWGPAGLNHTGPACLSKIVFTQVPEESTRAGELEHGQVDAAETILPPDYTTVQSNPDLRLYVVPGAGADYQYLINTQQAPWNNTQLRIALRDSINLPALLKGVYQGEYTQAWGPIMPDTADYDPAVRCPGPRRSAPPRSPRWPS